VNSSKAMILDYPYKNPVSRHTGPGRFCLRWQHIILLMLLGCCGLALLAGPARAAAPAGRVQVAATIVPLGDFCRRIGGDLVQVQVLIPPGASPHVFEPAPSVMAKASQARVFVYIGAGLEPWAAKLLHARDSGDLVVVEAAKGIPLIGLGAHHHEPGDAAAGGHDDHHPVKEAAHGSHPAGNPHIWLDPVLAQGICRKIAGALIQTDPAHRARYEANLKSYLAALVDLNREIETRAQTWRLRKYVSFHPAFAYFAKRYHLHEVGTIEAAPGREPTPRHLQNLVAAIRRYGIKVVFAEPQLNPRVAQVIAQEAGVKVLMLDPMGGRPPYGSDYLQLMRYNLAMLDQALK
jgi:zinc transport system substrate-binding protein